MYETYVTIQGRLVADPTTRTTGEGVPVTNFRLAQSARTQVHGSPGTFADGPTSYYDVSAFRGLGVNTGASLSKGDPVTVWGKQRVTVYPRSDGSTGVSVAVEALAVGHDLRYGTTRFAKVAGGAVFRDDAPAPAGADTATPVGGFGDPATDPYVVEPSAGAVPEEGDCGERTGPLVPLEGPQRGVA